MLFRSVLKDGRANKAGVMELQAKLATHFMEQGTHGQKFTHGGTEGNILGGSAAEGDVSLQLASPDDGTAKEGESESSARLHRDRVLVILITPESSKVSINIAVKPGGEIRCELGASEFSAIEVSEDAFDGLGMRLTWRVGESGSLMDGKLNVGAGVGRDVQQHANHSGIAPRLLHG